MNENKSNDLQSIITQVIEEMKSEQGDKFDLNKINLAEMERRTASPGPSYAELNQMDSLLHHMHLQVERLIQQLFLGIRVLLMIC